VQAGQLPQALPLLEKVNAAAEKFPELNWVFGELLSAYRAAGEDTKAVELLLGRVAQARAQLPADSPQLGNVLAVVSLTLVEMKKWEDAEPLLRDCLAIREQTQPDFWSTFNTRSMLGGALLERMEYSEAEPLLLSGYKGMKEHESQIPPAGLPRLTEALQRPVQVYEALEKPEEAARWQKELDAANPSASPPVDQL
jgi:tetratricopeptide (TPR) repeat protein